MDKNSILIAKKIEEANEKVCSFHSLDHTKAFEKTLPLLFAQNELLERYLASPEEFSRENYSSFRSFFARLRAKICRKSRSSLLGSSPRHLFDKTLANYALLVSILSHEEFDLRSKEEKLLAEVYENLLHFPLA